MRLQSRSRLALLVFVVVVVSALCCETGQYQNSGKCYSCPINCQSCTPIEGKCMKCANGYELDTKQLKLECVAAPPLSDAWKMILLLLGMLFILIAVALVSACYYLRRKRTAQISDAPEKAIDPTVVARNQSFLSGPPTAFDPTKDECTVCLSDSTNILTACGHRFHLECFQEWAFVSSNCPNCNTTGVAVKYLCGGCSSYSLRVTLCKRECLGVRHEVCARRSIQKGDPCVNCSRSTAVEATNIIFQ